MSKLSTAAKRLVLGRPFRSDTLGHELLPKRTALPVFASDALSSVAYAPEEIFLVLSVAGLSAYAFSPWIGLAVAFVLVIVVAGYRQTVRAYPSGGGDYEVATKNLGPTAGLTVGSALLVDYVLTVAVSLSSAAATVGSAVPFVARHKVLFVVVAIVLLTAVNLRGLRRAGRAFAVLTYTFVGCMLVMLGAGLFRIFVLGDDLRAESADFELVAEQTDLTALAFVLLLTRAFSSGCAALTGVEAISTGVPASRSRRHATPRRPCWCSVESPSRCSSGWSSSPSGSVWWWPSIPTPSCAVHPRVTSRRRCSPSWRTPSSRGCRPRSS